jgi:hypothetical protein
MNLRSLLLLLVATSISGGQVQSKSSTPHPSADRKLQSEESKNDSHEQEFTWIHDCSCTKGKFCKDGSIFGDGMDCDPEKEKIDPPPNPDRGGTNGETICSKSKKMNDKICSSLKSHAEQDTYTIKAATPCQALQKTKTVCGLGHRYPCWRRAKREGSNPKPGPSPIPPPSRETLSCSPFSEGRR